MIGTQCAILVGGLGTRLGELARSTPKPLLPVDGRPFVEVLIGEAVRRGFTDFVLLAGHQAQAVEDYAADAEGRLPKGCRIRVSIEPEPLGTGGALVHAFPLLADRFLLLNGDTWFDFNWLDLALVAGDGAAVGARAVADAGRYETLRIDASNRVTAIVPRAPDAGAQVVNGGVYWLRKSDLAGHPRSFSIEGDLLPKLAREGTLVAKAYDGFFLDIGVPEAFAVAQALVPQQRLRPALFLDRDGVLNHDDHYVATPARFRWIEGAREAVRLANDRGYYVFVVTNQAGVAKGRHSEADVQALHQWMAAELREEGAWIDDWRYCPFHKDALIDEYRADHPWRKPSPGMLFDLMDHWPIRIAESLLIGDTDPDLAAATAAGVRGLRFTGGNLLELVSAELADLRGSDQ